ncbi:hypothetical protein [Vreelandella massiliensis]|uniref:hypothetical protein n=1 Tax=Vreelandella massiliensis TaxID=1816686 RepID=UPI00096A5454|nr:hypothetical protein [Halomonas massiliensis]
MSLGTALGSALDTFTGIQEYKRDRRLGELKEERYSLMNEGSRISNKGGRFDNRVKEVKARVAEYLEPHSKREGVAVADKAEEAVLTQEASTAATGQLARQRRLAGDINQSNLNVLQATEGDRIGQTRAESQSAIMQADRERIADVQDGISKAWVASGENLESAMSNDFFIGGVETLAEKSFGVEVTDTRYENGGLVFTTSDGKEHGFSEDEAMAFISDTENIAGHMESVAQNNLVESAVADDLARRQNGLVEEAETSQTAIESLDATRDEAQAYQADLSALQEELASLNAETEGNFGPRGSGFTSEQLARRVELNEQIEALEEEGRAKGLDQFSLEEYGTQRGSLVRRLGELGPQAPAAPPPQEGTIAQDSVATTRNAQRTLGTALEHMQAGELTGSQIASNLRETGNPAVSLSDHRATETAGLELENKRGQVYSEVRDNAVTAVEKHIDAQGDDYKPNTNAGQVGVQVDGFLADNPEFLSRLNTARGRQVMEALVGDAAILSSESGVPVSVYLNGAMRYSSPNAKTAMVSAYEDDFWNSGSAPDGTQGRELRLRAAERAAELVETRRINPTTARTQAISEIQEGRIQADGSQRAGSSQRPSLRAFGY